jgi:CHAT domain-containing protein
VIASLWTVSDQSTAYLMEHLYRGLRDGLNVAAALGAAMNDVRAEYDHPYFWAPFVVSGSGLGVADASSSPPTVGAGTAG